MSFQRNPNGQRNTASYYTVQIFSKDKTSRHSFSVPKSDSVFLFVLIFVENFFVEKRGSLFGTCITCSAGYGVKKHTSTHGLLVYKINTQHIEKINFPRWRMRQLSLTSLVKKINRPAQMKRNIKKSDLQPKLQYNGHCWIYIPLFNDPAINVRTDFIKLFCTFVLYSGKRLIKGLAMFCICSISTLNAFKMTKKAIKL